MLARSERPEGYPDSRQPTKPLSHPCKRVSVAYAYQESCSGPRPRASQDDGDPTETSSGTEYPTEAANPNAIDGNRWMNRALKLYPAIYIPPSPPCLAG